jgi:hypothetical protein
MPVLKGPESRSANGSFDGPDEAPYVIVDEGAAAPGGTTANDPFILFAEGKLADPLCTGGAILIACRPPASDEVPLDAVLCVRAAPGTGLAAAQERSEGLAPPIGGFTGLGMRTLDCEVPGIECMAPAAVTFLDIGAACGALLADPNDKLQASRLDGPPDVASPVPLL